MNTKSPGIAPLLFSVAAWAGLVGGLLEGIVLAASGRYPVLNAAHKVGAEVIWIAPLVDVCVFSLVGVLLLPVCHFAARAQRSRVFAGLFGIYIFAAAYNFLSGPRVIQNVGVFMLSFGLAVVFARKIAGREENLAAALSRRYYWVPAGIAAAWFAVFAWGWGSEALAARSLPPPPAGAPSVLVVVMDTLRADRFTRPPGQTLTPHLDQFAVRGVRFENAWSTTSWSLPSQASIMTGLYPFEHETDWPSLRMTNGAMSLAEYFDRRGYVTGAFSGNAAWVTPEYLGRGYLRFQVYQLEDYLRRTVLGRKFDKWSERHYLHSAGRGKKAPQVNAEFLRFLDDYPERPFYAYLCYMDVNQALHDRRYNHSDRDHVTGPQIADAYDRALTVLDGQIQDLLNALEARGRLKNTVVFITSDHGQSFGSDYDGDHPPAGHETHLYQEESAVPLFVVDPGRIPEGLRLTNTAGIRQIPATVADLLNLRDAPFPGPSLSASWSASPPPDSPVLLVLHDINANLVTESVVQGTWQYVNTPTDKFGLHKGEELFDRIRDPLEKNGAAREGEAAAMLLAMRDKLKDLLAHGSRIPPPLRGQETQEHPAR